VDLDPQGQGDDPDMAGHGFVVSVCGARLPWPVVTVQETGRLAGEQRKRPGKHFSGNGARFLKLGAERAGVLSQQKRQLARRIPK
jgi:hypothetical protein